MITVRGCAGAKVRWWVVRWCVVLALSLSDVVSGFPPSPGYGGPAEALAAAGSRTTLAQGPPVRGLTAAPRLARAYDVVLDARFDEIPRLLDQTCGPLGRRDGPPERTVKPALPSRVAPRPDLGEGGPAPAEACQLLDTVALWWQIQLDPLNPTRDEAFIAKADAAIAAAEAWTLREPLRAEAWFYLGGAYGARAQFRSLRRELLSAVRDGRRIKASLEQALALDPAMQDAYFGIGLYHYYADVAPTALKMLRWLLLLPGGDREQGLQEMLRARSRGELARSEADYQLQLLYIWYEKQPARALEILAELHDRHPHNPHFLQLIAEVHDVYLSDPAASARAWQVLLDEARRRSVAESAMAEATARLGLALQLDRLGQGDAAIAHLRAVIAARPQAPYGALARAHVQLGDVLHRAGRQDDAAASYRAALAAAPPGDPMKLRAHANAQLRARR